MNHGEATIGTQLNIFDTRVKTFLDELDHNLLTAFLEAGPMAFFQQLGVQTGKGAGKKHKICSFLGRK